MTLTKRVTGGPWLIMLVTTAVMVFAFGYIRTFDDWFPAARLTADTSSVGPWTAIGSSGTVDDSSISSFAFTGASAGYRSSTSSIVPLEFRYKVENVQHPISPSGFPSVTGPGWTTLEVGAQAPGTSIVIAYLYRVNRCTGAQSLICYVQHTSVASPGACRVCQFSNTTFNFTSYLYYVRVVVDRNTTSENPWVHTLRIY